MSKGYFCKTGFLKSIALIVLSTFLSQQLAYAAPLGVQPVQVSLESSKPQSFDVPFKIPESIALVDETYQAGPKTIILIQDAHTNDSGQIHIAEALNIILRSEDLKYIFIEAGTGDNSLSFLRDFGTKDIREKVALSYLRKGLLQGAFSKVRKWVFLSSRLLLLR